MRLTCQTYLSQEPLSPAPANPIVPVLGPVTAPGVGGLDATSNVTAPVGLQPVISWAQPNLGTATHYVVAIVEVENAAGPYEILSAVVLGSLSFKIPPGFLKAGYTYFARVTANNAPWVVLDGNPLATGAPTFSVDRVTGTFTP